MGADNVIMSLTPDEMRLIKAYRLISEKRYLVDIAVEVALKQEGIVLLEPNKEG